MFGQVSADMHRRPLIADVVVAILLSRVDSIPEILLL